ncbi:uncharacterized protein LOC132042870 [Lycium ferocissimum]|uniref:uncharacterized protein LOC132042870 n=1 Tax=Lycium ferocissimum TaxID=112874 RepID=UPI002815AA94|nr:uncharacterized protein LOC132042870 [Lycium ferocissimum]
MSNLSKLEFVALDISEKNYLSWVLDDEIHLDAKGLGATITQDLVELWTGLKERITSQLKLCGEDVKDEDMLEKTLTTFHASNLVLQQQYREREFKKHADLISCLLVAEKRNTLLLKNHETRPPETAPFPEANVVEQMAKEEQIIIGAIIMRVSLARDDIIIVVVVVTIKGKTIWVLKTILQEAIVIVVV